MHSLCTILFTVLLAFSSLTLTACTTMEDCCECLVQANAISCTDSHDECVEDCFKLCESTRACYCSNAREVGCEEECGCVR